MLPPETKLLSGSAFPRSAFVGDVRAHLSNPLLSEKTASGHCLAHDIWGGEFGGVRGMLGFSLGRRVSLMLTNVVGAVAGMSGLHYTQLWGIWTFDLTFWREGLSFLDIAFVAAASFPPKQRSSIMGHLLDESLVATFLGPLLTAKLRAPAYLTLFATDASLSPVVSLERWTKPYDLSEDLGESVRLDRESGSPVETILRDSRAFAAFLTAGLP